jgi:hypothetical protein
MGLCGIRVHLSERRLVVGIESELVRRVVQVLRVTIRRQVQCAASLVASLKPRLDKRLERLRKRLRITLQLVGLRSKAVNRPIHDGSGSISCAWNVC